MPWEVAPALRREALTSLLLFPIRLHGPLAGKSRQAPVACVPVWVHAHGPLPDSVGQAGSNTTSGVQRRQ
jgi:hypothetical protein